MLLLYICSCIPHVSEGDPTDDDKQRNNYLYSPHWWGKIMMMYNKKHPNK